MTKYTYCTLHTNDTIDEKVHNADCAEPYS